MADIRKALELMDLSLTELESCVDSLENAGFSGVQPDMFPETKQAVVKSLDTMIQHVETMIEQKAQ